MALSFFFIRFKKIFGDSLVLFLTQIIRIDKGHGMSFYNLELLIIIHNRVWSIKWSVNLLVIVDGSIVRIWERLPFEIVWLLTLEGFLWVLLLVLFLYIICLLLFEYFHYIRMPLISEILALVSLSLNYSVINVKFHAIDIELRFDWWFLIIILGG